MVEKEIENYVRRNLKYLETNGRKLDIQITMSGSSVSGMNIKASFVGDVITRVFLDDITSLASKYRLNFTGIKLEDGKTGVIMLG
jgi:hypothetical protein